MKLISITWVLYDRMVSQRLYLRGESKPFSKDDCIITREASPWSFPIKPAPLYIWQLKSLLCGIYPSEILPALVVASHLYLPSFNRDEDLAEVITTNNDEWNASPIAAFSKICFFGGRFNHCSKNTSSSSQICLMMLCDLCDNVYQSAFISTPPDKPVTVRERIPGLTSSTLMGFELILSISCVWQIIIGFSVGLMFSTSSKLLFPVLSSLLPSSAIILVFLSLIAVLPFVLQMFLMMRY